MDANLAIQSAGNRLPAERSSGNTTRRLTAQQQAAQARAERQADIIQDAVFAAGMAGSIPVGNGVGAAGFKVYLDRLLKEAGNPSDPIERMLVEQLALAHQRVAQLHIQAAEAKRADEVKQYMSVAIRLTGELRRMALAIKQYRQPTPTKKKFTLVKQHVKQQNVANGDQQIAYVDQSAATSGQEKVASLSDDRKQGSRLTHDPHVAFSPEEPQASSCRAQEPAEARSFDAGRPGEAAAIGIEEPALGEVDWTQDA